jgi:hypothetical protein
MFTEKLALSRATGKSAGSAMVRLVFRTGEALAGTTEILDV